MSGAGGAPRPGADAAFERLRAAFEEAQALEGGAREAFLAELAARDAALAGEVARMLAAAEGAQEFLEPPVLAPLDDEPAAAGARIGGCRIVRPLGRGGMGTVYEALQERPHRRVALKTMNPGLLTASALRRFRWESEVLAHLRHPGIAQVYEAGVETGPGGVETPWFSMEFIDGAQDLVAHARERRLPRRAALELFLAVVEAVHFAHQKGVLHRDLKPANVLVGRDGRPKVIDFGVARVARDGEEAFATHTGELVGTLAHMSPEQLGGDPRDVDAKSDVYALGLLLHELLCGTRPYDLAGLPLADAARVIQERPPAIPATLPPELRWILLRALEKEPARRYASAAELGHDVARALRDEPVLAGPPSTWYRASKFVRRHRLPVAAGAAVAVSLAAGLVLATLNSVRAANEAEKFERVSRVLQRTLASVLPEEQGRDARVVDLLEHLAREIDAEVGERAVAASLQGTLAQSYLALGLYDEAEAQATRALASWDAAGPGGGAERLAAEDALAQAQIRLGRLDDAAASVARGRAEALRAEGPDGEAALRFDLHAAAIALARSDLATALRGAADARQRAVARFGPDAAVTIESLEVEVDALRAASELDRARAQAEALLEARRRHDGVQSPQALLAAVRLARIERELGRLPAAEALLLETIGPLREVLGEGHERVLGALNDLAVVYYESHQSARAGDLFAFVLEALEPRYAPDHPEVLLLRRNLESVRNTLGEGTQASEASLRAVLESTRRLFGPDHVRTLGTERNLGFALVRRGDLAGAEPLLEHALATCRRVLPPDHVLTLHCLAARAYLHFQRGEYAQAVPLEEEALAGYLRRLGPTSEDARQTAANLAAALTSSGRVAEAIPVLERSLRTERELCAPGDPRLLVMTINLGDALLRHGDLAQAEEVLAGGLSAAIEEGREAAPETRHCMGLLAQVLAAAGQREEALALLEEVFAERPVETELPLPVHLALRCDYGVRLYEARRFDESERQLRIADEAAAGLGAGIARAAIRGALAELYRRWQRPDEAERWRALAREAAEGG